MTRRRVPVVLLVPAVAAAAFLVLPLVALVVRAPWATLPAALARPATLAALRLSVATSGAATVACLLVGVPLGWLLARVPFPGRRLVRALVTLPLVVPPVVGGVALLLLLGRRGLLGAGLDLWFGVRLPFTTAAVVVAEAFVALPFLVLGVEGAVRGADARYEAVAATLGATPWVVFRRVTLPGVAPGVAAGAVLAWARALGEFGATITFAGNFPGTTRTVPLAVYGDLEAGDLGGAVVLSLVLLGVSVLVLAGLRERWLPGAG